MGDYSPEKAGSYQKRTAGCGVQNTSKLGNSRFVIPRPIAVA
jgi:hypothetical protein